jgi:hypothetical protein
LLSEVISPESTCPHTARNFGSLLQQCNGLVSKYELDDTVYDFHDINFYVTGIERLCEREAYVLWWMGWRNFFFSFHRKFMFDPWTVYDSLFSYVPFISYLLSLLLVVIVSAFLLVYVSRLTQGFVNFCTSSVRAFYVRTFIRTAIVCDPDVDEDTSKLIEENKLLRSLLTSREDQTSNFEPYDSEDIFNKKPLYNIAAPSTCVKIYNELGDVVGSGFRIHDWLVTANHNDAWAAVTERFGLIPAQVTLPPGTQIAEDVVRYRLTQQQWSVLGIKKFSKLGRVTRGTMMRVQGFSPIHNKWIESRGVPLTRLDSNPGVYTYNANTVRGMSGGPVTRDDIVYGIHLGAKKNTKVNVFAGLFPFFAREQMEALAGAYPPVIQNVTKPTGEIEDNYTPESAGKHRHDLSNYQHNYLDSDVVEMYVKRNKELRRAINRQEDFDFDERDYEPGVAERFAQVQQLGYYDTATGYQRADLDDYIMFGDRPSGYAELSDIYDMECFSPQPVEEDSSPPSEIPKDEEDFGTGSNVMQPALEPSMEKMRTSSDPSDLIYREVATLRQGILDLMEALPQWETVNESSTLPQSPQKNQMNLASKGRKRSSRKKKSTPVSSTATPQQGQSKPSKPTKSM